MKDNLFFKNVTLMFAFAFLVLALSVSFSPSADGKSRFYTKGGLALEGYDAVAYFKEGRAVAGSSSYSTRWGGAEWRFASAENRAQFISGPSSYAPQFGGYCAYGISQGYAVRGAPKQWTVYRGKLYMNYNASVRRTWEGAKDNFIALARKKVSGVLAN